MTNQRLPLLRGKTAVRDYKSVGGGSRPASLPRPDPAAHRIKLLRQLDALVASVEARPDGVRDKDATREIVAVRPSDPRVSLDAKTLADTSSDVRVVGTDPDTGVVLLDAPGPNLERLREKSAEYGELKTRKKGDGTTTSPAHVAALGPVEQISVAADSDLAGVRLREWSKGHGGGDDRKLWFELAW